MTATNVVVQRMLPCGLHLIVIALPDGVGLQKVRQFEFLWVVEVGATVRGRGYNSDRADALAEALKCAQSILDMSQVILSGVEP